MQNKRSILAIMIGDFRKNWRSLALTDVAYKLIEFILIVPLVGGLFRLLVGLSGSTVLVDHDLVSFFLRPLGWICLVLVGGLSIAVVGTEQCALLSILAASRQDKHLGVVDALKFAAVRALRVINISARLVAVCLVISAPFLAASSAIFFLLLNQFDINFYLTEKPPIFRVAAVLIAIVLGAQALVLLRFISGWFFALPIVVFESDDSRHALKTSRQRATGHRKTIALWVAVWAVICILVSASLTGVVGWVGRWIVPGNTESIGLLVIVVGGLLMLWFLTNLAANLLGTITFAVMIFNTYQDMGGGDLTIENQLIEQVMVKTESARFQLTPRKLVVTMVLGVVLSAAIGIVVMESFKIEDKTQIAAHRGASAAAPENTMAAVDLAIAAGADYVEIDVQETADGEVVVFHDSDFKKIAGLDLKIWDATMQDLQGIDVGSWFDPKFKAERVPTLKHVLERCRGNIQVKIELKYYGHDRNLEQKVVDIVEAAAMPSDIVVMSLKIEGIRKIKALRPHWRVGLVTAFALGDLTRTDADFLAVHGHLATRPFIRSAHQAGKAVHAWTINDAVTMSNMMSRGVNCLITDKPQLARTILQERAGMNPVERMLMELASLFGVQPDIGAQ